MQRQAAKQLGSTGSKTYASVAIVVVESAALYSLFGIIYIPLMVLQKPVQFPFSSLIGTLTVRLFPLEMVFVAFKTLTSVTQLIAPNLIILRMALTSVGGQTTGITASQGAMFPDFGGFKAARTPGTTPIGVESGITVSQVTVTESRMASDTFNSVESAGTVDSGPGGSAERLVRDGEKVKVQNGRGVWAVVV